MEGFQKVKDEIVCYNRKDLIRCAIKYLNRVDTDLSSKKFPYWTYLTLVRWSLKYSTDVLIKRELKPETCKELGDMIFNLMSSHDFADFNLYKGRFFQVLAYQQFRFQRDDFPTVIARSFYFFVELENSQSNKIRQRFEDNIGISIKDFIGMLSVVYFSVKLKNLFKWDEFEYAFKFLWGKDKSSKFLNALELNTKNPTKFLQHADKGVKFPSFQIFDNEPFFDFPLLYTSDNSVVVLNSKILINTAELYFYKFASNRELNKDIHFGYIFEKYVSDCLEDIEMEFIPEKELKNRFPNGNVVDFLIQDNVLLECKAVEMKAHVSVFPSPEKISKEIKDSITKAYVQQILRIATKLRNTGYQETLYGIILTYRDPFLGRLKDYWELFLKKEIDKISKNKEIDSTSLPVENVFIISINDFEKLLLTCRKYQLKLSDILEEAVLENQCSRTEMFSFIQHLEKYDVKDENISFLRSSYNRVRETFDLDRFLLKNCS